MQISAVTPNISYNQIQKANFSKQNVSQVGFRANPCVDASQMAIKQTYSLKNINYLLPNQIWSDERILKTVENFNNVIERLFSENKMKLKYLQREIGKILPNYVHARIKVRDFSELTSENQKRAVALTSTGSEGSNIYIKFLPKEHTRKDEVMLKEAIGHELTHALNAQLQNTSNKTLYEHKFSPKNISELFINFTTPYLYKFKAEPEDTIDVPNTSKLLEKMNYPSIEDFYKDLNNNTDKLEDNLFASECIYLGKNSQEKKDFYNLLAEQAKDEKMAYQTTKVLRELTGGRPAAQELKSIYFGEVENFFKKKADGEFEISEDEEMEILRNKILDVLGKKDSEINIL